MNNINVVKSFLLSVYCTIAVLLCKSHAYYFQNSIINILSKMVYVMHVMCTIIAIINIDDTSDDMNDPTVTNEFIYFCV